MTAIRTANKYEIAEKGEKIYEKIKEELEPEHTGEIAFINVNTGDYFLGNTRMEAYRKARKAFPDEVFYIKRIGYRAVRKETGPHPPQ